MENKKPIASKSIVLREEDDDWAVLFDPDEDNVWTMDPIAVFVWKHLDGKHTVKDISKELNNSCKDMPKDAETYIKKFVDDLIKKGLAGYKLE